MASEWHRYRLAWRLASPLHIGYRTIGTIARTRLWVPGRNIWAVLVDTIARLQAEADGQPNWKDIQKLAQEHLRFEAWFLASGPTEAPWAPRYTQAGLYYGDFPAQAMERMVLASSVGTAIEHGGGGTLAAEGQLFEIEYISPRMLSGSQRGDFFWLVGNLWARSYESVHADKDGISIGGISLSTALASVTIGGKQTRGFGRLTEGSLTYLTTIQDKEPLLQCDSAHPFPLLVAVHPHLTDMRGQIEPIVGRDTHDSTPHDRESEKLETPFCWLPGSFSNKAAVQLQFIPNRPGIATLEIVTNSR